MPPRRALQDHVHAERPGLFGTACAVHGQIPVEPRLLRDAENLTFQLPENNAVVLFDIGNHIEDSFEFLFIHEARCAVCPLVGVDKIAFPVIRAVFTVAHAHDHEDQQGQRTGHAPDAVKPVGKAEHRAEANKKAGVWKLRRCTKFPARSLPDLVIAKELADKAPCVKQSKQGGGKTNQNDNSLFSGNKRSSPKNIYNGVWIFFGFVARQIVIRIR